MNIAVPQRSGRILGLLSTVCALALSIPVAASAATLTGSATSLNYTAAAGETNNLVIDRTGGVIRFTDSAGITITPSGTCTAVANVATCPAADVNDIRANAGDMNDSISVPASIGDVGFIMIVGNDGNDVLTSLAPKQTQMNGDLDSGGTGNDVLTGGPGEETMVPAGGNDLANAGPGDDRIINDLGNDTEMAGPGNDLLDQFLKGPDGADVISGGEGNDRTDSNRRFDDLTISLNGVADDGSGCPGALCENDNYLPDLESVTTGHGNDTLIGSDAANRLDGASGNDSISGLGGGDQLNGNDGADFLDGGDGSDSLFGGQDADTEQGGAGDDQMSYELEDLAADSFSGGPGFDGIGSDGESQLLQGLQVSLDGVANDGIRGTVLTPAFDNVLADVEDVQGSSGPDVLIGSARPNQLEGFSGADRIDGGAGPDGLIGGRGGDRLTGGKGRDDFDAGPGADRLLARDGKPDELRCGSSLDRGKADRSDRQGPDCDKVKVKARKGKR